MIGDEVGRVPLSLQDVLLWNGVVSVAYGFIGHEFWTLDYSVVGSEACGVLTVLHWLPVGPRRMQCTRHAATVIRCTGKSHWSRQYIEQHILSSSVDTSTDRTKNDMKSKFQYLYFDRAFCIQIWLLYLLCLTFIRRFLLAMRLLRERMLGTPPKGTMSNHEWYQLLPNPRHPKRLATHFAQSHIDPSSHVQNPDPIFACTILSPPFWGIKSNARSDGLDIIRWENALSSADPACPPVCLVIRSLKYRNDLALLESQIARLVGLECELCDSLARSCR